MVQRRPRYPLVWIPRVYGNWPGNSSGRRGRSSVEYRGLRGMPEIVDVSMPSSRAGLDSKSSFQACCGSRVRTFTSIPLWPPVENLLGCAVRRVVLDQARGESRVVFERTPHSGSGDFRRHLDGLVLQPLLG